MIVFHSDDYLRFKRETEKSDDIRRFLKIAKLLPMELQMVLCNRLGDIPGDLILTRDAEAAFKRVAARLGRD